MDNIIPKQYENYIPTHISDRDKTYIKPIARIGEIKDTLPKVEVWSNHMIDNLCKSIQYYY